MPRPVPTVPPVGSLFGSSGFDGSTSSLDDLVGLVICDTVAGDAGLVTSVDLVIGRQSVATIRVRLEAPAPCLVALNDTVVVGGLKVVAIDRHHWVLQLPAGAECSISGVGAPETPDLLITEVVDGLVVSTGEARLRRSTVNLDQLIADRRAIVVGAVDELAAVVGDYRELAAKCVSVIRVNTLSAGDGRSGPWTTPDRIPHRDMWLWDTAFHSVGVNLIDPQLSAATIRTMTETAQPDGLIPLSVPVTGPPEPLTQPPILAWAVRENLRCRDGEDPVGRRESLAAVQQPLGRHLDWVMRNRCDLETGLGRWHRTADPSCRCGESGMDNSPRFDLPTEADVDLSVYLAFDLEAHAWVCDQLDDGDGATRARERAVRLRTAIHERLWDPDQQFYVDRRPDGTFSTVRAVSGFLPLLLGDLPADRKDSLLAALADPDDFGTPCPIPSVSRRDAAWSTDMWRGPAWVNMNFLVINGLLRQGCRDEARRLAEATVAMVERWYRRFGTVFEFYDSDDRVPPIGCDRKGRATGCYQPWRRIENIRDYHWTAGLTLHLLSEGFGRPEPSRQAARRS